jgi:phosphatidylserine synthase 1
MIFIFLCISLVAFPNGPFTRPHPLVWRLVLGISVLYWMGLVFALFQSYGDLRCASPCASRDVVSVSMATGTVFMFAVRSLRSVLVQYDPTLSESYLSTLDSPDYAADCSLTVGNLWSRADVFLLAHFLGWIVKALLFRSLTGKVSRNHPLSTCIVAPSIADDEQHSTRLASPAVCWISSVTWELTEIIFAPMLPNFYECWWDQFVYDILICNAGGIFIGYKLCRYLEMKSYRSVLHAVGGPRAPPLAPPPLCDGNMYPRSSCRPGGRTRCRSGPSRG